MGEIDIYTVTSLFWIKKCFVGLVDVIFGHTV